MSDKNKLIVVLVACTALVLTVSGFLISNHEELSVGVPLSELTPQERRQVANERLAQFWTVLSDRQDAYYAKHGKYFQLLVTPETRVIDGEERDFTARIPDDERNALDVLQSWQTKLPFQIKVDEWVGPEGAGYRATVTVEMPNGRIFMRSRDNSGNDTNWYEYVEENV